MRWILPHCEVCLKLAEFELARTPRFNLDHSTGAAASRATWGGGACVAQTQTQVEYARRHREENIG
jgi:hypothetical protein